MDFIRNRFRSCGTSTLNKYNGVDELLHPCSLSKEELNILYPRDSDGRLVDVLEQYINTTSDIVRQRLSSYLTDNSTTAGRQFAKLDDETKLRLLRPRNMQSMSEIAIYTKFVKDFIDSQKFAPDSSAPDSSAPDSSAPDSSAPDSSAPIS